MFPFTSYPSLVAGVAIGILAWVERSVLSNTYGGPVGDMEGDSWFGWGLLPGAAFGRLAAFTDFPRPSLTESLVIILGAALMSGLVIGTIGGFLPRGISPRQSVPNKGMRRSARRVRSIAPIALAVAITSTVLIVWLSPPSTDVSTPSRLLFVLIGAVLLHMVLLLPILLWAGGKASLQHLVLRRPLVRNRAAPWKYVEFLDEATDRLFLRKVGGGYVFVHRLLLDYFADLPRGEAAEMTPPTTSASPAH